MACLVATPTGRARFNWFTIDDGIWNIIKGLLQGIITEEIRGDCPAMTAICDAWDRVPGALSNAQKAELNLAAIEELRNTIEHGWKEGLVQLGERRSRTTLGK